MDYDYADVIDFCSWQQRVDFERVAAHGVKGVIFRFSRGHVWGDIACRLYTHWAQAAGLWTGGYHVLDPARDAVWQADCFCHLLNARDFPPALDLQETGGQPGSIIAARSILWLDWVEQETNLHPMIYTRKLWFDRYVGPWVRFKGEYPLWVAHYTNAAQPMIPKGWETWDLWQYSKRGRIPGISGYVDLNRVNPDGKLARILSATGRTVPDRDG